MFQACDREYSLITRHVDFTRAVTAREVFSLRPGLYNIFMMIEVSLGTDPTSSDYVIIEI